MCIGTVMQVIQAGEFSARCRSGAGVADVDLALVGPQPDGAWLLVLMGTARNVLTEKQAQEIVAAHAALSDALSGGSDVSDHFPDLGEREIELPQSHMAAAGK